MATNWADKGQCSSDVPYSQWKSFAKPSALNNIYNVKLHTMELIHSNVATRGHKKNYNKNSVTSSDYGQSNHWQWEMDGIQDKLFSSFR